MWPDESSRAHTSGGSSQPIRFAAIRESRGARSAVRQELGRPGRSLRTGAAAGGPAAPVHLDEELPRVDDQCLSPSIGFTHHVGDAVSPVAAWPCPVSFDARPRPTPLRRDMDDRLRNQRLEAAPRAFAFSMSGGAPTGSDSPKIIARRRRAPHSSAFMAHSAWFRCAVALIAGAGVSLVQAQVYKCTDDAGRTIYSDAPCAAASKPLRLPSDVRGRATNANMCAQLLDETRRLAAETERDAGRGRAESASRAKRRNALAQEYEARCAGIAWSDPTAK